MTNRQTRSSECMTGEWFWCFSYLSPLRSLSGRPGLLWPPSSPGVPPVWHRGGHLLHLHHGLTEELSIRWLSIPTGSLWPPRSPTALLQQPEPGRLPGSRWASPSQLPVPQRVHRHQLLPHPAHPQPGQRLRRLQETQHASERGYAVICGAGQPAASGEPRPASNKTSRAEPTQLRRVEHGGERLWKLWGGDVLRPSFGSKPTSFLWKFASFPVINHFSFIWEPKQYKYMPLCSATSF